MARIVLSLGSLANRTHLPVEWLRKQVEAGTIPCLQIGRRRVFSLDAVEAALDEMAAQPPAVEASKTEAPGIGTPDYSHGEGTVRP